MLKVGKTRRGYRLAYGRTNAGRYAWRFADKPKGGLSMAGKIEKMPEFSNEEEAREFFDHLYWYTFMLSILLW